MIQAPGDAVSHPVWSRLPAHLAAAAQRAALSAEAAISAIPKLAALMESCALLLCPQQHVGLWLLVMQDPRSDKSQANVFDGLCIPNSILHFAFVGPRHGF